MVDREGEVVGFVRVDDTGFLDLLYVHADLQRQGIASALMERVQSWASTRNLRQLTCEASITPRPFFEHLGFRTAASQTVERRGVTFRNFRMQRAL